MARHFRRDPVQLDRRETIQAGYVVLAWFVLVAAATVLLLFAGANAGA
jgi:hypothetical protein